MPGQAVTLSAVEECLAAKRKKLAFPPAIEAAYHEQMFSYRVRLMQKAVLPVAVIYNIFLIADLLLLPETFVLAAVLHLLVVTPIVFLAAFAFPRVSAHWMRELAAAAIPVFMVAQIMFIYWLNQGLAANHYQYLAVMVVIYMNVTQRFGFRLAVCSTFLLVGIYLGALLPGHSAFEVKFIGTSLMVAAGYVSLMANRRMEQDLRFAFLHRLRDRLRREGAEEVARRDALTGLANRRYLDEMAASLWASGTGDPVAVVMIDVDHFKAYNDRYGHVAGDTCLKRIAGAVASELRSERDLAVRVGGEEFLMLLAGADMSTAVRVAERVRRQIEGLAIPHETIGPKSAITASLGVTAGPVSAHSLSELVAAADAALYAAKRAGRNQVWPPFVKTDNPVASLGLPAGGGRLPLARKR